MKSVTVRKSAISLLEILIVIFLIGIISSVVAFNLRGSLDQGKVFQTKQMKEQLEEVFTLALMQDPNATPEKITKNPKKYLENSPLIKDPSKAILDGWKKPFTYSITDDGGIEVHSANLEKHEQKNKKKKSQSRSEQDKKE